ncbi:MAG: molybdopterin adenylyltransferase [Dehalococcoidales bacterium]|nr:molybdopterin adenylyltransferase [Dehalococcoidales bacterium]
MKLVFTVGILTLSDKGSRGERVDVSGPTIKEIVTATLDCQVVKYEIIPDDLEIITNKLAGWCDEGGVDVILTTGGTGLSARDVTPEATLSVIEKEVPGIPEAVRAGTLSKAPTAMLSRAVAGIRKKTLIINMPGSPKAVKECLEIIVPALPHAVDILKGTFTEH